MWTIRTMTERLSYFFCYLLFVQFLQGITPEYFKSHFLPFVIFVTNQTLL